MQAKTYSEMTLAATASRALTQLNADALEALALRCVSLVRGGEGASLEREMDESGLAVLSGALDASRANLNVLRRLGLMRSALFDYGGLASDFRALAELEDGKH